VKKHNIRTDITRSCYWCTLASTATTHT